MSVKNWTDFEKMTRSCYMKMAGSKESAEVWDQAYEVLKEVLAEERRSQPEYAVELYDLDEITDYEYDVQGWLEDYLDDLDVREDKEKLLKVCDELLELFRWEEDAPSDIRFMRASALRSLGRNEEAVEYCKAWLTEEANNLVAVAANIYALISVRDLETAEKLIAQYIPENAKCMDENDILFTAAAKFYRVAGNEKALECVERELDEYARAVERYLAEWDDGEEIPFG